MKNCIVFLSFLNCWLLAIPAQIPSDQVSKNAAILEELRYMRDAGGMNVMENFIYEGGKPGIHSKEFPHSRNNSETLMDIGS